MAEIGTLVVNVGADTSEITEALRRVRRSFIDADEYDALEEAVEVLEDFTSQACEGFIELAIQSGEKITESEDVVDDALDIAHELMVDRDYWRRSRDRWHDVALDLSDAIDEKKKTLADVAVELNDAREELELTKRALEIAVDGRNAWAGTSLTATRRDVASYLDEARP